jgi:CHASE3 domain sensor protein
MIYQDSNEIPPMLRSKKHMFYSSLLLGGALVLLIGTYWYSTTNLISTRQSADLVAHSYHVKNLIEQLSSTVKDAERGERGYLLTRDNYYMDVYHSAIQEDERTFTSLKHLTSYNPTQQRNLAQVQNLVHQRVTQLQKVLDTQASAGPEAAQALIRQGRGKQLMQGITSQVQAMQQEEDRLLVLRQAQLAQNRQHLWFFSILFFVISLALLVGGYIHLRIAANRYHYLLVEKNHYADQLEQSNQTLALVATVASHDLSPLLRKTNFFMEEILKDPANTFSSESRDFFLRMQRSSGKLQAVVEHVLAIARRQTTPELPTEPINLKTVAEEVREALEKQIGDAEGQVEIQDMCTFNGDKYEIAQLMQSLVENGLKHTRQAVRPVIQISARLTEGGCEIRVTDNGLDVAYQQKRDMLRFFGERLGLKWLSIRPDPALMDLRTARQIIWRHQGSLRVESQEGQGSECIVTLPMLVIHEQDRFKPA